MKKLFLVLLACAVLVIVVVQFGGSTAPHEHPAGSRQNHDRLVTMPASESGDTHLARIERGADDATPPPGNNAATRGDGEARLQAQKLAVDNAGNGRATPEQAPQVAAAFRFLGQHAAQPAVVRLLAGPGLTHYTVSKRLDGSEWVLVESTAPGANRGGLNLRWDAAKGEIASMWAWGEIQGD